MRDERTSHSGLALLRVNTAAVTVLSHYPLLKFLYVLIDGQPTLPHRSHNEGEMTFLLLVMLSEFRTVV